MHNTIRQTVPYIDNSVSKKEFTHQIIFCTVFYHLESLPLVVIIVDLVKFGTATMSYLPDREIVSHISLNHISSDPPIMYNAQG